MTYKIADIEWNTFEGFNDNLVHLAGIVNGKTLFFIYQKTKKIPKYELQAMPFKNDIFPNANVTRKLFTDTDLEKVKTFAQDALNQFVNIFTKKH